MPFVKQHLEIDTEANINSVVRLYINNFPSLEKLPSSAQAPAKRGWEATFPANPTPLPDLQMILGFLLSWDLAEKFSAKEWYSQHLIGVRKLTISAPCLQKPYLPSIRLIKNDYWYIILSENKPSLHHASKDLTIASSCLLKTDRHCIMLTEN